MKLSYTGTKKGMTQSQKTVLRQFFRERNPSALIHGGCIGGDDEADQIAAEEGIHRIVFPASTTKRVSDDVLRARGPVSIMPVTLGSPLLRNPKIVAAGDELCATPKETREVRRSGTWATVRIARRTGKPVHVFYP